MPGGVTCLFVCPGSRVFGKGLHTELDPASAGTKAACRSVENPSAAVAALSPSLLPHRIAQQKGDRPFPCPPPIPIHSVSTTNRSLGKLESGRQAHIRQHRSSYRALACKPSCHERGSVR
ncbi:hypothetical protein CI238_07190 [Colletotrichum incanum]|uniref:Uncharacterized protein n=1 Tax=Colletotrichum incanum TaxID=1573173 RepID=A0A167E192_COLIC|nr:hypothetical protein CI238_07190 [Colletotrichum incanum]